MDMKKLIILAAVLSAATLLAGCDNAEQVRKERCTELQGLATDGLLGKISKDEYKKVQGEWKSLQCRQSDIIQG